MPSCVRSINIVNGTPNPNAASATMYITCTASHNNQAQWSTGDQDVTYTVTLPSNAWTPPTGGSLTFSVVKGTPSGIYTIKSDAPNGSSAYTITPASITADPPSVMIDS
ncbi:MAG TPA: hypothetical protein VNX18_16670 [Bryobacteraceae bacterium]|nr:hypothetical protein [Bryobacteraceae bacterium]